MRRIALVNRRNDSFAVAKKLGVMVQKNKGVINKSAKNR
jgi:hypothetical protein